MEIIRVEVIIPKQDTRDTEIIGREELRKQGRKDADQFSLGGLSVLGRDRYSLRMEKR